MFIGIPSFKPQRLSSGINHNTDCNTTELERNVSMGLVSFISNLGGLFGKLPKCWFWTNFLLNSRSLPWLQLHLLLWADILDVHWNPEDFYLEASLSTALQSFICLFAENKQDHLRMNVAPDLNNHLRSIGLFRSRKIDQKFSIFVLTSAAVLLHSPARGKKTRSPKDECSTRLKQSSSVYRSF